VATVDLVQDAENTLVNNENRHLYVRLLNFIIYFPSGFDLFLNPKW